MNKYLIIFVAVLLVVTIVGCARPTLPQTSPTPSLKAPTSTASPKATVSTPVYGGDLKIIMGGNITGIGRLGTQNEAVASMYARVTAAALDDVVRYDVQQHLTPRLAESWNFAPDGKSITLNLRKGVKFHDGTDFNAQALKFNLDQKIADPVQGVPLKAISNCEVLDTNTLRLNLKAFDATLMYRLSNVVSPTAWVIPSTPETMAKNHVVGTGPFKYVNYKPDDNILCEKNTNYWQPGKPYLDSIQLLQIADPVTALLSFKKGDAQVIFNITPRDAKDLEAAGYTIVLSSIGSTYFLAPDGANPDSPFAKREVREAVEYAIDKKTMASALGLGYYSPAAYVATARDEPLPAGITPRNYDPAKAKQLLASAGFPTGFKTEIVSSTTVNKDVLVVLQTYLKDVGIEATLNLQDQARLTTTDRNGWKNAIYIPNQPINGVIVSFANRFSSAQTVSMYRGDWQQKLNEALAQFDDNKRDAQIRDLVKMLHSEVMIIPVYMTSDITAQEKRVHDLKWTQGGHQNHWEPQDAWFSK